MLAYFRYLFLFLFFIALALSSCEPEEERIDSKSDLKLTFSTDTVQFDTVFSGGAPQVRNITRRLMVYNPHDKAVNIASIILGKGNSSSYSLYINGQQEQSVNNQELLGGDSLLILVNLRVDPRDQNLPFLVRDSILFEVNQGVQDVKLIAYGQDATFLSKGKLACDEQWYEGKPYVLQDTLWVGSECTLTINKGTHIYFNNNAALVVEGTVKVLGEKEARILFSNARLDLKNEVGLWSGLHFKATSVGNEIYYTDIRNASTAIYIEKSDEDTFPDLIIGNTRIENTSGSGIYALGADLFVYNSLINNTLGYSAEHEGGGNYIYEHCTLVNYATQGHYAPFPAVRFSNLVKEDGIPKNPSLKVKLYNNIIWSGGGLRFNSDLSFEIEGDNYDFDLGYNLIRSTDEDQNTNNNILNTEPDFPGFKGIFQYNYRLDSISPAIDKGKDLGIAVDLEGKERDSKPDIGAYEYTEE